MVYALGLAFVAVNVVTFALYAIDKVCAIKDRRRIPERTLLTWTALGGSLGAKLGQITLRHKTRKQTFARWLTVWLTLHIALTSCLLWWIMNR